MKLTLKTNIIYVSKFFYRELAKIVAVALVTVAFYQQNSHAAVGEYFEVVDKNSKIHGLGYLSSLCLPLLVPCFFATYPTLVLGDSNLALNSEEANVRLDLEAQGQLEKQITTLLASSLNVSLDEVIQRVWQLKHRGVPVTVEAILDSFSNP